MFEMTILFGALSTILGILFNVLFGARRTGTILYDARFTNDRFGIFVPAVAMFPDIASGNQTSRLKFEISKNAKGEFYWRLKAANGQTIATSGEGYKAKADCKNGIDVIKRGAATASVVDSTIA